MSIFKKMTLLCIGVFVIISCSSSSDNSSDDNDNFDRSALLTNMADNVILPALVNFQSQVSALDIARSNFTNNINQSNLDDLSEAWLDAYKAWQYVAMYDIGIAETFTDNLNGFRVFFNVYPVTTSLIENAAGGTSYDLNSQAYYSAQGFPALDFLIHGIATGDITALDKFSTNLNADGYIAYMTDVQSQINNRISTIVSDWQNTFRNEFVANTSSSATGSVSKIINDFINYYERGLRANKIGIPAGNFSNDPLPNKVEAFYKKDVSKELALASLDGVIKIFNGQTFTGASSGGESFASYLDAVDQTDLKNDINNQFQVAKEAIESLDDDFVNQINTDNTKMTDAYDALQRAVILLKVDMASALNVIIDFLDNDGD